MSTPRFVDPFRDMSVSHKLTPVEKETLRIINQQVAAKPSLNHVADFLFERTRSIIPCDRIGLAFLDDSGQRVIAQYARATYEPLLLTKGYAGDLRGSSLERVLKTGRPRIIDDLQKYLVEHPSSSSTQLLTQEGVRSSLTCPLIVEGRVLGFMFCSSREPNTYTPHHVELQMAISERLSQAVEKAWRIEQLTLANQAYLEMLAFVSHEIKNPVASMVTDAQLLAGGYLGPLEDRQRDKVERLIGKGEFLLKLVQDYLDLARIDGGGLELHARKDVDVVADIVAPVIDVVRSHLDQRGMRLTVDVPDEEVLADCDPALMRIVLTNLLSNAAKYGRQGGDVRMRIIREPARLEVSVWNEGEGFAAGERDHLFRRFSRLHPSDHPNAKGTGVGLYSTWRIIQLHNGRIRARSEPGSWAEFSFELSQPLELPGAENTGRAG